MDDDKKRELIDDVSGPGPSNCCGASVYEFGDDYICKDCHEHCGVEKEETSRQFGAEQLEAIERMKNEKEIMEEQTDIHYPTN